MKIEILDHDMKVNQALYNHAWEKLQRLDHYLPNLTEVRVDFTHQHTRRGDDLVTVQLTARHSRGAILRSQVSAQGDIEAAFNEALDRMHRQIARFKGKRDRKGRERFSASVEEIETALAGPLADNDPADIEETVLIVRRKEVEVAPMNEAEAIEQMELLGHDFFIYFDEPTGAMRVAYKRRTGGYGILVPKPA